MRLFLAAVVLAAIAGVLEVTLRRVLPSGVLVPVVLPFLIAAACAGSSRTQPSGKMLTLLAVAVSAGGELGSALPSGIVAALYFFASVLTYAAVRKVFSRVTPAVLAAFLFLSVLLVRVLLLLSLRELWRAGDAGAIASDAVFVLLVPALMAVPVGMFWFSLFHTSIWKRWWEALQR